MIPIKSDRERTPRDWAGIAEGAPRRGTAGGHIADLAELGKAIVLCGSCRPKFDALRYNYVTKRNIPFVVGRCDGCKEYGRAHFLLRADQLPR